MGLISDIYINGATGVAVSPLFNGNMGMFSENTAWDVSEKVTQKRRYGLRCDFAFRLKASNKDSEL